jgi:hypothetical protein
MITRKILFDYFSKESDLEHLKEIFFDNKINYPKDNEITEYKMEFVNRKQCHLFDDC